VNFGLRPVLKTAKYTTRRQKSLGSRCDMFTKLYWHSSYIYWLL